ncbi:putative amidase [Lophiostoma macrostomum CBS 122681]|uniref:Putative amidase n=1 Tax=Lophiostoma macrostomum CBS 122681 TaxID=1314788 RepID=A0A6A6SPP1_9PLEO|nr:putative amidase [Lophiostoma macrostomum CBS 122681]
MSIISLAGSLQSTLEQKDVHELATRLGISIPEQQDAEDYLLLLKSFEAVMQNIEASQEYIHPSLLAHPTLEPRTFWKPDKAENPLNAWSHQCEFKSSQPTSDLLKDRTIVIKDNICVAGLPTTLGTSDKILSGDGKVPLSPVDATVVSRLLAAGVTIKGSSTCENFCASPLSFSSATGPVHHPLLHGYTTGGSSSGSCALVAAHKYEFPEDERLSDMLTAELAIGSDQAGSVRIPASYCGLYGLKPTHGLVPYTGASSMSPMIDHLGPIAANVKDIAKLLKVMAGWDGLDSRMTPESPLVDQVKDYPGILVQYMNRPLSASTVEYDEVPGPVRLKIGLLMESFDVPGVTKDVKDGVLHAAKTYFGACRAEIKEVSVPMHLEGPIIWTAATRPSMTEWLCQGKTSGYLSHLPPHIKTQWPPTQETYELLASTNPAVVNIMLSGELARDKYAATEAKAHRKVFELRAAYDKAFEEVDVLITPTAPSIAMPHPKMFDEEGRRTSVMEKLSTIVGVTSNTCPFNVTGHPAMSVPAGWASVPDQNQPDRALPFGMQIVGRRWHDEDVLEAAAMFDEGHCIDYRVQMRALERANALRRQSEPPVSSSHVDCSSKPRSVL